MEAPSTGSQTLSTVTVEEGKTYCKCGEGWKCEFTQTKPSNAFCRGRGKSGDCCSNPNQTPSAAGGEGSNLQQTVESATAGNVNVVCGKGWTCTVTKTDGPDSGGKDVFQCGNGCSCVIDETTGAAKCRCAC